MLHYQVLFLLTSMLRCYCAADSLRTGYVYYGGPKENKRNESISDRPRIVHIFHHNVVPKTFCWNTQGNIRQNDSLGHN